MNNLSKYSQGLLFLDITAPIDLLRVFLEHTPDQISAEDMQDFCNQYIFKNTLFSRDDFEDECTDEDIGVIYRSDGYELSMFESVDARSIICEWIVLVLTNKVSQAVRKLQFALFPQD